MAAAKVRLSLEVSEDLNRRLELLAEQIGSTKSEFLRKAIALMEVAVDAKLHGQDIGILDGDVVKTKIIGI